MKFCHCLLAVAMTTSVTAADNWSRFRGENGTGVSLQTGIPTTWTAEELAWQIDLPGVGHSSPCIWHKTLFVTSAIGDGTTRLLMSINADTGAENWRREISLSSNHRHRKNSWASGTPTTNGKYVYVTFADEQSYVVGAWDFSGEQVWTRNLGEYESRHGVGASPIVAEGLVVITNDQLGPSSIVALNANTGEPVWQTPRTSGRTSYVTPMLTTLRDKRTLVCVSAESGVSCLDLATGALLWETGALPHRTIASPVISNGIVLATCGNRGQGKYLAAVDLNSSANDSRIVFERRQRLPYVPTPVAWEDLVFLWGDGGVVSCMEMPSGTNLWTERVNGNYSSSPICVNGHIYCITEKGVVTVIRADREFELLARTSLNDSCHATPAVANGHLYLRTFHRLFAVKAK